MKSHSYLSFIRAPELGLVNIGRTHDPETRLQMFQLHSPVNLRSDGEIKMTNWAQATASEESLVQHLRSKQVKPGWFELTVLEVANIFEIANKGKKPEDKQAEIMALEKKWFQAGYQAFESGRTKKNGWKQEDLPMIRASRSLWRLGYDAANKPLIVGKLYKDWMPKS